jgi:hypothetical protein
MAKKAEPSKYAAALQYLQQMRDRAADFGGGVVDTLADRARDVGGLAYEALTSDPNMGRMTTAEFSQAAANRPSTPRLDATAQGIGAMGKALVTQPVQTAKAVVVDPVVEAFESPRAMGQFAGEFVNPLRIAAALRKTAPIAELDVFHGTPHRFDPTEENPLGEFDASKIGTGEGQQVYGHGIYLAEAQDVGDSYRRALTPHQVTSDAAQSLANYAVRQRREPEAAIQWLEKERKAYKETPPPETMKQYDDAIAILRKGNVEKVGNLYKADLPDDMIDRMLDYDKPINEQSQVVLDALERAGINTQSTALAGPMAQGQEAHLAKYGIPGIKYLDEGSRGATGTGRWKLKFKDGTEKIYNFKPNDDVLQSMNATAESFGTRNFVVFPGEEKKVRILERDGQKAPPQKIAQALEAAPQGGKVVGIRSRQTAKMANRINEAMGGGPQPLSDNVQREMKLATSVLQSKNPQAVEDWIQAYYNADLPMEQFEAATGNLRKTLLPETVNALIQNAGTFRTADQFKAFLNATPEERAKQLAKVSK